MQRVLSRIGRLCARHRLGGIAAWVLAAVVVTGIAQRAGSQTDDASITESDSAQAAALLRLPHALEPGRALDIGCGSGRDAVHLAARGWQVTAVEFVDKALARARQRATEEGVDVRWVRGDVGELGRLGLEPGYSLLYDFGCIQGLSDSARRGAAAGLTELAAPGARLLFLAFKAGRRIMLPRGMDREHLVALLGNGWDLQHAQSVVTEDMPPPVRRAQPTLYRLARRTGVPG